MDSRHSKSAAAPRVHPVEPSVSERAWTAGPWAHEGPDAFGDYNILHPANSLAIGGIVQNLGFTPEQTKANALLISAAPCLFEALASAKRALRAIADSGVEIPLTAAPAVVGVLSRIEAALAKATTGSSGMGSQAGVSDE